MLHLDKVRFCQLRRRRKEDKRDNWKDVRLICLASLEVILNLAMKHKKKICCKVSTRDLRRDMNKSLDINNRISLDLIKRRNKNTK